MQWLYWAVILSSRLVQTVFVRLISIFHSVFLFTSNTVSFDRSRNFLFFCLFRPLMFVCQRCTIDPAKNWKKNASGDSQWISHINLAAQANSITSDLSQHAKSKSADLQSFYWVYTHTTRWRLTSWFFLLSLLVYWWSVVLVHHLQLVQSTDTVSCNSFVVKVC